MKVHINGMKYMLASVMLANMFACSDDDLTKLNGRYEQENGTRTAELVSKTITLDVAGTLETKVSESMGDAGVATLEKLVLSGPFTSTDMQYVRDSLTGLKVLDMVGVEIKASDVPYKYDSWSESVFEDDKICDNMFRQMNNLREVYLPSTITVMGESAFSDCDSLRTVEMPDDVTSIGRYAFASCDSLSTLVLPAKLTLLGDHALEYCISLTSIVIPDSIKILETHVLTGCYALKTVTLPKNLEEIRYGAFWSCTSLANIQIPENVTLIGERAFHDCGQLKILTVPASVTYVGEWFVSECRNLRALIWNSTIVDVPNSWGCGNCFLFPSSDQIGVSNLSDWKSVILNGVSASTINVDNGNYNDEFANMKEFTAKKLVYSRDFWDETTPGGSSGWQTIVLPFTPDSIYHETKGRIAPFNSGIEGAKPFWLRELTNEGFVDVTTIEPNKPYIIAMPNHSDYTDEYRLNGTITFVARDSVLRVTPSELTPSVGPEFELHPTYRYMNALSDIYVLSNDGWNYYEEEDMYYQKSFFKKSEWAEVYKFNAYVTTLGGGRSSRTMFDLDTRSKETRAAWQRNTTGIPQIGDM